MAKRHNTPSRPITTTKLTVRELFRQKLAQVQERNARITALLQQIADLEHEIETRPLVGGPKLHRPECAIGCTTCYLGCAMLPDQLATLERELDRQGGVPWALLKRDGLDDAGRAQQ